MNYTNIGMEYVGSTVEWSKSRVTRLQRGRSTRRLGDQCVTPKDTKSKGLMGAHVCLRREREYMVMMRNEETQ